MSSHTDPDTGFVIVTVQSKDGPYEVIAERTASPHLVIHPSATVNGWEAFGDWTITHVPTGTKIPTFSNHDVDIVRSIATQLAESEIDWTMSAEELATAALPLVRELIEQAINDEQAGCPPGFLAPSALRMICAQNERIMGRTSQ